MTEKAITEELEALCKKIQDRHPYRSEDKESLLRWIEGEVEQVREAFEREGFLVPKKEKPPPIILCPKTPVAKAKPKL